MNDKTIEAFEGTRKAGSIAAAALDEVSKIVKPRSCYLVLGVLLISEIHAFVLRK